MRQQPTFNGPLTWSTLFIVVAAIAVIAALPPLAAALFSPGTSDAGAGTQFAMLMEEHEDSLATYQARFDGRSVFFKPPQPPPTTPVRTGIERPIALPPIDNTPVIPSDYTGPTIRALIGDTVWFHGGVRVTAGEEANGVKVLSVNAPWSAKVAYAGGEYDVSLFEKGLWPFFRDPNTSSQMMPPGLIDAESEEGRYVPALRMSTQEQSGAAPPRTVPKPPARPPDVPPE
jgi:hypothetical protein